MEPREVPSAGEHMGPGQASLDSQPCHDTVHALNSIRPPSYRKLVTLLEKF